VLLIAVGFYVTTIGGRALLLTAGLASAVWPATGVAIAVL
jgi:hypothetical protein